MKKLRGGAGGGTVEGFPRVATKHQREDLNLVV